MRIATAALAAMALLWRVPVAAQESYRVTGDRVAVYNLAGRARVVAGQGPDVQVVVRRGGDDAARLQVAVSEVDGRQALRVTYPGDRVIYPAAGRGSRTRVRVDDDGTFGDGDHGGDRVTVTGSGRGLEAWADLEIRVPPGRDLALHVAAGEATVEDVEAPVAVTVASGSVSARGVRGALSLDTGSGSVTVSDVEGALKVDTGSGQVRIDGVRGDQLYVDTGSGGVKGGDLRSRSVRIDTGSGGIALTGVAAPEVILDTGSGGIDLEVPVVVRSVKRDHLRGRIGDGNGRLHVETGSGAVRLLRGGSR